MQKSTLPYELKFAETGRSAAFFYNGVQVSPDFTCHSNLIKVVLVLSELKLITSEKHNEMLSSIIENKKMPAVMPDMMNFSVVVTDDFNITIETSGMMFNARPIRLTSYYGNIFAGFRENIYFNSFFKKQNEGVPFSMQN